MDGGEEDNSKFKNKFYWTFFELSNGKIISLLNNVDYEFEKITCSNISCHYTECYKFGDDFFVWFDKTFSSKERNLEDPNKEEVYLVEDFFRKNIEAESPKVIIQNHNKKSKLN